MRRFLVRRGEGVSPVIGVILLVAITVVLGMIVWIMVPQMVKIDDDNVISVQVGPPNVHCHVRGANNTRVWDVDMEILKVRPVHEEYLWEETVILVKSENGSVLHQRSNLTANDPASYDTDDSDGITIQFWYVEITQNDTRVSSSDGLKITGVPDGWQRAEVELYIFDQRIASANLPSRFP